MSDWRKPYDALWRITDAATFEEMARLWAELDGPAQLKALKRRAFKFMQSPRARPWHGTRRLKPTVRDYDLAEALRKLHLRVKGAEANPVFEDPRATIIGEAILDLISEIVVWDEKRS